MEEQFVARVICRTCATEEARAGLRARGVAQLALRPSLPHRRDALRVRLLLLPPAPLVAALEHRALSLLRRGGLSGGVVACVSGSRCGA